MRLVRREQHKLDPQKWRMVITITDTPTPGETYLSLDEIQNEFAKALDLPAGISYELGTLELLKDIVP